MFNRKALMLLMGGVILSGCGPEPSDPQGNNPAEPKQEQTVQRENSAQAGDSAIAKSQTEAAHQAAEKAAEAKANAEAEAQEDARAKSQAAADAPQYDMQSRAEARAQEAPVALSGRLQANLNGVSNPATGTARYEHYDENPIKQVSQAPLVTFSLDVDTGSYANVRRFLNQGQLPPPDAVRVEEMLNYFPAPQPIVDKPDNTKPIVACKPMPFAVKYELAPSPWNAQRTLLKVDVQARDMKTEELPPANLVFLIDTSGSMQPAERLPLIQSALKLLVNDLRAQDNITIVTYAGGTHVALAPTAGNNKTAIKAAIDSLDAYGSTGGEAGLRLAYEQAEKGFIKGGVNRILLTTDGDFNLGITDPKDIEALVKKEREKGITLSTLGVGDDNFNEAMMVRVADVGNGNYSYIDSLSEAQKVLNDEMHQTLVTIAKDVKSQIEFNPQWVTEYRQIGYEKRQLRDEDFNNDKVDAGDIGAGKHVTLFFELTLNGQKASVDKLRYAQDKAASKPTKSSELAWIKLRWKAPQASESTLAEFPVVMGEMPTFADASEDFRFQAAVAAYGQKLRGSEYLADTTWPQIIKWGEQARGEDKQGYRAEFIKLVKLAQGLSH
ncbi:VWA domain-containing protein [Salmonella enterica subsp. salamae]|nr:VWA domain-containing protein [Salmonella enterica subsp. salamae]